LINESIKVTKNNTHQEGGRLAFSATLREAL